MVKNKKDTTVSTAEAETATGPAGATPGGAAKVKGTGPDYVGVASGIIFAASLVAFGALWVANHYSTEYKLIPLLFSLPLVGQFTGLVVLFHRPRGKDAVKTFHHFYLCMMAACMFSYSIMWALYLWHLTSSFSYNGLYTGAVGSLAAVAVVMGLVILMTLALMCRDRDEGGEPRGWRKRLAGGAVGKLNNLKRGASEEPFQAFLLFFTAFLSVSFLFGFAYAFHDKAQPLKPERGKQDPERALYMKQLGLPDGIEPETQVYNSLGKQNFRFENLQAIPDVENADPEVQEGERRQAAQRKQENWRALNEILKLIKETPGGAGLRVVVIGRASEKAVPGSGGSRSHRPVTSFQSNYELSEARANNVKYTIMNALLEDRDPLAQQRWQRIRWECLPRTTEADPASMKNWRPRDTRGPGQGDEGQTVEVLVERMAEDPTSLQTRYIRSDVARDLTLMDYIYFANYTITTTGYGDIIPLTYGARFITTLANICEVFFLVVFFNALLSFRVQKPPGVA